MKFDQNFIFFIFYQFLQMAVASLQLDEPLRFRHKLSRISQTDGTCKLLIWINEIDYLFHHCQQNMIKTN